MALDLGHTGILVNAVAPGPAQTGRLENETLEHARSRVPLGRWITGQILQVAGGHAL